ncbi:nicotinate (nicotinamide) nucleotide adenylyltransferase [Algoriphagus namhaensis]
MKIGLFFGSFNPIHIGHLIIANTIYDRSELDQVWFVVSPQNPLKKRKSLVHEFDRLRMVELAIEDNFHFRASDVEFAMPKPSYTIDTLTYLSERHPDHEFSIFLGSDNLRQLKRWKNYEQILAHFQVFVYPRPGDKIDFEHPSIREIDAPLLDISATFIRESIKNDRSVTYLLPEKVIEYIRAKGLYL